MPIEESTDYEESTEKPINRDPDSAQPVTEGNPFFRYPYKTIERQEDEDFKSFIRKLFPPKRTLYTIM